ncbi:MAG: hypothetical protein QOK05_2172 [Chloroflexota bacterium]|jgi:hypothetical protein|nr:hypothetical protein [Chloroflexota bacterium]
MTMNDDIRRQIVAQVADGSLTPFEAAAKLDQMEAGSRRGAAVADSPRPSEPLKTVSVSVSLGQVVVIGDSSVREVVADGAHTARRDGDRTVIEGDALNSNGFTFGNSRGWFKGNHPWKDPLTVRMNPDLALEVVVQGGKAHVRGVHGPIKAEVHAGAIDVVGFRAPIDIDTEAGTVKAAGRLSGGASHIRCGAGSVRLELDRESSLRVTAHSELGQVSLDGDGWRTEPHVDGKGEAAVIGSGAGTLDVDVTIGGVRLTAS